MSRYIHGEIKLAKNCKNCCQQKKVRTKNILGPSVGNCIVFTNFR